MHDLSDTQRRRSDSARRRRRVQGAVMLLGVLTTGALASRNWEPKLAPGASHEGHTVAERAEIVRLNAQVERARGDLKLASAQLERWNRIFQYSHRYRIPADLAAAVYDAALLEHVDPELAFPLVRLESEFRDTARSSVGAIGLTQLMLSTARFYDPDITREKLYDRDTNLRIGFRYLRDLIREQHGDVRMALLVYNRGPAAVEAAKELALDVSNGYDRIVMKGYRGKGTLD